MISSFVIPFPGPLMLWVWVKLVTPQNRQKPQNNSWRLAASQTNFLSRHRQILKQWTSTPDILTTILFVLFKCFANAHLACTEYLLLCFCSTPPAVLSTMLPPLDKSYWNNVVSWAWTCIDRWHQRSDLHLLYIWGSCPLGPHGDYAPAKAPTATYVSCKANCSSNNWGLNVSNM